MDQTAYPFVSRICLIVDIGVPLPLTVQNVRLAPRTGIPCITTHDGGLALRTCYTTVLTHYEDSGARWCLHPVSASSSSKNSSNRSLSVRGDCPIALCATPCPVGPLYRQV